MKAHTCHPCPFCNGKAVIYEDSWGHLSPYMKEDTDSPESCDFCEGTGREGSCDRCEELAMGEFMEDWQ